MAAVAWFTGAGPRTKTDQVITSMRQSGAPESVIEAHVKALAARGGADADGLWAEHEAPTRALYLCGTQWRMAGSLAGVTVTGLDYTACDVALRRAGLGLEGEAWADFQTLEGFACALLNGKKPAELRP